MSDLGFGAEIVAKGYKKEEGRWIVDLIRITSVVASRRRPISLSGLATSLLAVKEPHQAAVVELDHTPSQG